MKRALAIITLASIGSVFAVAKHKDAPTSGDSTQTTTKSEKKHKKDKRQTEHKEATTTTK